MLDITYLYWKDTKEPNLRKALKLEQFGQKISKNNATNTKFISR